MKTGLKRHWRVFAFILLAVGLVLLTAYALIGEIGYPKIGLVMNIIGSIMIAVFGVPQPDFSNMIVLALNLPKEEDDLKEHNAYRKKWHFACSYLGFTYLIGGFILQLL